MQIVYTSAIQGIAGDEPDAMDENMEPLFKAIMGMPQPIVKQTAPLQVSYLGMHIVHLLCFAWLGVTIASEENISKFLVLARIVESR